MWHCVVISDPTLFDLNALVEKLLSLWNSVSLHTYFCVTVLYMKHIKQRVKLNYIMCDPSTKVQIKFFLNIVFVIMFMIIQSFNKMK